MLQLRHSLFLECDKRRLWHSTTADPHRASTYTINLPSHSRQTNHHGWLWLLAVVGAAHRWWKARADLQEGKGQDQKGRQTRCLSSSTSVPSATQEDAVTTSHRVFSGQFIYRRESQTL